jgi:ubiquitin conjugation factor E4 B
MVPSPSDIANISSQTPQLVLFDRQIEKMRERIDSGLSYKLGVQGVLFDDLSQARSMQFMRYVIVWMLRTVSSHHDFPRQELRQVNRDVS